MVIEQEPFRRYNEEKKADTFTIRLSPVERERFERDKKVIEQKKDSTAMKQLALIGSNVIHHDSTGKILSLIFKNKRKNKRIGIVEFED